MPSTINITYECPHCYTNVDIEVEPFVPAQVAGPPDKWAPAEGGCFEPDICPRCHGAFDPDTVWEAAVAQEETAFDDYINQKIDEARGK